MLCHTGVLLGHLVGYCFQEEQVVVFKNNRLLFPYSPKRVVEILKKWAPPHQVAFKCPPPGPKFLGNVTDQHLVWEHHIKCFQKDHTRYR